MAYICVISSKNYEFWQRYWTLCETKDNIFDYILECHVKMALKNLLNPFFKQKKWQNI